MDDNLPRLNLCLSCRRRLLSCVCPLIESFHTNSRFLILMHPMEYKKEKVGTGRFSHLILKNSHILVGINFDDHQHFRSLLSDPDFESFVLYPGKDTIDLGGNSLGLESQKKAQFIILDGTWPCAKKMMKLSTCLHPLPRVSFSHKKISEFKVKHQPLPGCLSTVESLFHLITNLNRLGVEDTHGSEENLLEVFRHTVTQQLRLAADPARPGYRKKDYSSPQNRKISKKWSKRSLFFNADDE